MNDYSHKSVSYVDSGGRILYLRQKCSTDEKIRFIGCVPTIVKKSSWDKAMEFGQSVPVAKWVVTWLSTIIHSCYSVYSALKSRSSSACNS